MWLLASMKPKKFQPKIRCELVQLSFVVGSLVVIVANVAATLKVAARNEAFPMLFVVCNDLPCSLITRNRSSFPEPRTR